MRTPKMTAASEGRKHRPPRAELVRAALEQLTEALAPEQSSPAWDWIRWPAWARSPEHARRLGEREGIRLTKIGRDLYGHRADLDALADRNAIAAGAANDGGDDEIDPEVAAAFASVGRR